MNEATANVVVEKLEKEGVISVVEAAKMIPTNRGKRNRISAEAVVRWIKKGKGGIFLEGFQDAGKSWWTSREAVRRFFAQMTAKRTE